MIECKHCGVIVQIKICGTCPICGAPITNHLKTMDSLPELISISCHECHHWVSAIKIQVMNNYFHHETEYGNGLYKIEDHIGKSIFKTKCKASKRVFKQAIRLSKKRKLT